MKTLWLSVAGFAEADCTSQSLPLMAPVLSMLGTSIASLSISAQPCSTSCRRSFDSCCFVTKQRARSSQHLCLRCVQLCESRQISLIYVCTYTVCQGLIRLVTYVVSGHGFACCQKRLQTLCFCALGRASGGRLRARSLQDSQVVSTSTHYETQILDLVFDVHVSAQRLSCVGTIVRTAKYVRCFGQAPHLRQQTLLTPRAPTRPKTMSLKCDQNQGTNNCTVIVAVPLVGSFLKPFLVTKFRSIFDRGNAAQIRL